mmetsp:Transcript_2225/g.5927  ORF Transcript_2225/g.5927 Transcript_2225/m.5927 type:complete len:258 (-) Transcript_2225:150-923(-)
MPEVRRLSAHPTPTPTARTRSGKTSGRYTPVRGPNPMEKNARKMQRKKTVRPSRTGSEVSGEPSGVRCRFMRPRTRRDAVMPSAEARRRGLRPSLSARKSGKRTKSALQRPTAAVAQRTAASEVTPRVWKMVGVKYTRPSVPVSCWKTAMPQPTSMARRIQREVAQSTWRHGWVPCTAAFSISMECAISARMVSRSDGEARHAASRMAAASGVRPRLTSQRGDSGSTASWRRRTRAGRPAPMPIMARQLSPSAKPTM